MPCATFLANTASRSCSDGAHVSDPPSNQNLAIPARGRLEELTPFRLYYLAAAAESSGLLWLGEGMESVAIWMKHGTPNAVHCEALRLDTFLLEIGTLQRQQLEAAASFISRAGGDVLTGLFAAGVLNPSETFPLIQQHALAVIWRGLALERGPFAFDPSIAAPASAFPLGNRWQILSNAARKLDRALLLHRLSNHGPLAPLVDGSTSELAFTALETRVIVLMDGSHSLEALVEHLGVDADVLRRVAFLLQEVDRLRWIEPSGKHPLPATPRRSTPQPLVMPVPASPVAPPPEAAPAPPPPAVASAPPPSAPTPASPPVNVSPPPRPKPATPAAAPQTEAPQTTVAQLRQFVDELKEKDLFARLGVPRSKGVPPELKASFLRLAKMYHPDTLAQDAPAEMRSIRAEVLAFLNEAYQALANDKQRVEYLAELEAQELVGDVDVEAILEAEEQFMRGTHFFKARKYKEAFDLFDGCIRMNDREGEFYAWRGYSRFLSAADKRAVHAEAREDLRHALELNRRCSAAHLFDGHMSKLLELHGDAQNAYRKALEIEPGNVEAQRELRLYEQRSRKGSS
jgi:curved DNA-binding protein CbpA